MFSFVEPYFILLVTLLCLEESFQAWKYIQLGQSRSAILSPAPTVIVPSGAAREIQRTTPTHLHFANFIAHKLYALFI